MFFKETQYVKEAIPDFSWELLPDTLTILKQKCFAAKTHFRGRDYVAFYAPSIPLSDGAWKFGGLPGLILKVSSQDEDKVNWVATRLELNYKGDIPIPNIAEHTYLTWDDFVKVYMEGFEKFSKRSRSSHTETMDFIKFEIKIPSEEIIHPTLHTGNGAEY
ncbi:MAG: GLPGLI family protein [Saprospiraceae bacterium]|nr:GLPGLI family protein [Saprospiraceae bacterium]